MGPARALRLQSGFELAARVAREKRRPRPRLNSSRQVFDLLHLELRDLDFEVFEVLTLDARNGLARRDRISVGTLMGSLVHPREVFRPAVLAAGAAVILAHNHPSGDPSPSREDLQITERIVAAGDILGIRVLDHVIVGDARYISLADTGRMSTAT